MKRILYLFVALLMIPTSSVFAQTQSATIPRKVLALYNPQDTKDLFYSNIHQNAEIWLNHLGLEVIYRSITSPLPTDQEMEGYRGIFTWYQRTDAVPDTEAYCRWMESQLSKGRKIVMWGDLGFLKYTEDAKTGPACVSYLKTFGIVDDGYPTNDTLFMEIVKKDPAMVEFERPLDLTEEVRYRMFHLVDPKANAYLQIKRTDIDDSVSSLVFTSDRGGFGYVGFVTYSIPDIERTQWRIHPKKFFQEAFGLKGVPSPDVTTENGKRIFYNQIDGDGIFNVSQIDNKSFSGEIISQKIFDKYPTLPITVGIITGYLDLPIYMTDRTMNLYRSIYSRPNIQPSSHGYAHPLIWRTKKLALNIPGYTYTPEKEIVESVKMVNDLLQKLGIPKSTDLFQWTGDCLPFESEVALAYKAGLQNINGGGGRFDKRYDSYSYLYPIGLLRGNSRQIYTTFDNENPYTNLWQGPYYAFIDVIQSIKNSGDPIRLKPANLYYHFYSGEKTMSLVAVEKAYDYILSQEVFPMTTRDYVQLAQDFFSVVMEQIPGGYRITRNGKVKTLRFDDEKRGVDLVRSKGVLGYRWLQGNLYVFLDDQPTHDVYLSAQESPAQNRPYIESASFDIRNFSATNNKIQFYKKGWFRSELTLSGLRPQGHYQISINGGKVEQVFENADGNGKMTVHFSESEGAGPETSVLIEAKP